MNTRSIGHLMLWGSIALMILVFLFIEKLHLSFEVTGILLTLLFIVVSLSIFYLKSGIGEITDNYLTICAGFSGNLKKKFYYHEIKTIEVLYGWYDAKMKITSVKSTNPTEEIRSTFHLVDWETVFGIKHPVVRAPGNKVDEWLFPVLDELYNKCQMQVKGRSLLLASPFTKPLKQWHPPGVTTEAVYHPRHGIGKTMMYILFGLVVAITVGTIVIGILSIAKQ